MNYNVDYFIRKFEAIPEEMFCVKTRSNGYQRCALGWCYPNHEAAWQSQITNRADDSIEDKAIVKMFYSAFKLGVGGVNNGIYPEYQQPTPKQRILAALYDIKKMQQPQHADITKELAVLPINETSDLITTNILQ